MKIIRYNKSDDIDVMFLDEHSYVAQNVTYLNFKRGQIKNPFDKSIYGIGYLGKHFVEELDQSDITVKFIVDKKAEQSPNKIAIYRPDDLFPEVDVIVVTAIVDFDDISDLLESKVDCPIVSLEDIIYEL